MEGVENTRFRQIFRGALLQKGPEMEQNLAGGGGGLSDLPPFSSPLSPLRYSIPYLPYLDVVAS